VTTQQRNSDGSYAVAEAVCFVPGITIVDTAGHGNPETGIVVDERDFVSIYKQDDEAKHV